MNSSIYELLSINCKLNEELTLQFLLNLFDGEARRYYHDKVVPFFTFTDAKKIAVDQYNNSTSQNRLR